MSWKPSILNRRVHRWGALAVALPLLIVILSGILLQLKKESSWLQPKTVQGQGRAPSIGFDQILAAAASVPEAGIRGWSDIDRLDVQPGPGVVKVKSKTRWEVQVDAETAEVLQVAYRRSDLIEGIHDGSWFHPGVKLWLFLPAALVLLALWATGAYLFILPHSMKRRNRRARGRSSRT